ncbi:hypothetical protein JCM9279_003533 [Rhodotorula babjevae]
MAVSQKHLDSAPLGPPFSSSPFLSLPPLLDPNVHLALRASNIVEYHGRLAATSRLGAGRTACAVLADLPTPPLDLAPRRSSTSITTSPLVFDVDVPVSRNCSLAALPRRTWTVVEEDRRSQQYVDTSPPARTAITVFALPLDADACPRASTIALLDHSINIVPKTPPSDYEPRRHALAPRSTRRRAHTLYLDPKLVDSALRSARRGHHITALAIFFWLEPP